MGYLLWVFWRKIICCNKTSCYLHGIVLTQIPWSWIWVRLQYKPPEQILVVQPCTHRVKFLARRTALVHHGWEMDRGSSAGRHGWSLCSFGDCWLLAPPWLLVVNSETKKYINLWVFSFQSIICIACLGKCGKFLWNWPQVNATWPYWCIVNIVSGSVQIWQ